MKRFAALLGAISLSAACAGSATAQSDAYKAATEVVTRLGEERDRLVICASLMKLRGNPEQQRNAANAYRVVKADLDSSIDELISIATGRNIEVGATGLLKRVEAIINRRLELCRSAARWFPKESQSEDWLTSRNSAALALKALSYFFPMLSRENAQSRSTGREHESIHELLQSARLPATLNIP